MMLVAETASGGEMIPPNRKPWARLNPGIMALDTKAITVELIITMGKAKLIMILRHFQKFFQEVCQAASYNNGGRKIKNTSSGLMLILEKKRVKLRSSPPITKTMG
jgi:hypothetical protein